MNLERGNLLADRFMQRGGNRAALDLLRGDQLVRERRELLICGA